MEDEILEIVRTHDWDDLMVVIESDEDSIKDDFVREDLFVDFIRSHIEKYEAEYEGYEEVTQASTGEHTIVFKFKFDKEKRLSSSYIKSLGDDIMIGLTDDQVEQIKDVEESIRNKFKKVVTIDTLKTEPMYYPFETPHTYLREDDDMYTTDHEGVMENAPTKKDGYVTVVKVVK